MIVNVGTPDPEETLKKSLAKVPGLKEPAVVVNDGCVVITGIVKCFYHKQLAGHAAIEMKCWKKITNDVKVVDDHDETNIGGLRTPSGLAVLAERPDEEPGRRREPFPHGSPGEEAGKEGQGRGEEAETEAHPDEI